MTAVANPVLIFAYLFCLRGFLGWKKHKNELAEISQIYKIFWCWFVLPYSVWMLYPAPNRFKVLLVHLRGTGNGPQFTVQRFNYYWNYLTQGYMLSVGQFLFVAAVFIFAGYLSFRRTERGAMMAFGYVFFCCFSTVFLSSVQDDRLLLNFFPIIFLVAAWGLGRLVDLRPAVGTTLFALGLGVSFLTMPGFSNLLNNFQQVTQRYCFHDERLVYDLRKKLLANLDGHRGLTTVGIGKAWHCKKAYP